MQSFADDSHVEREKGLLLGYLIVYFGGKCNFDPLLGSISDHCKGEISYILQSKSKSTALPSVWNSAMEFEPIKFIKKGLQLRRMMETECGWPPCALFTPQREKREDIKLSFKCGGCKLIRYCCRRHQKNHWKFIHSQQCRALSVAKQILL